MAMVYEEKKTVYTYIHIRYLKATVDVQVSGMIYAHDVIKTIVLVTIILIGVCSTPSTVDGALNCERLHYSPPMLSPPYYAVNLIVFFIICTYCILT